MALYIVDGNNLKGYLLGTGDLQSADDAQLVAWLRRRQGERRGKRRTAHRTLVFFDAGAGDRRPTGDSSILVRVAPPGITADEAIIREISRLPEPRGRGEATLITSDRALQDRARALGVNIQDCERFAGRPSTPAASLVETLEKDRLARDLGRSVDALFMPGQERTPRVPARRRQTRLSPRKVSQLRDPVRLAELLKMGDRVVRRRAALALARTGAEQGRKLLEQAILSDPVPSVRASAVAALGLLGEERSIETLRKAADDPFPLVRAAVATALLKFAGPQVTTVIESLKHDPHRRVRRAAMGS